MSSAAYAPDSRSSRKRKKDSPCTSVSSDTDAGCRTDGPVVVVFPAGIAVMVDLVCGRCVDLGMNLLHEEDEYVGPKCTDPSFVS